MLLRGTLLHKRREVPLYPRSLSDLPPDHRGYSKLRSRKLRRCDLNFEEPLCRSWASWRDLSTTRWWKESRASSRTLSRRPPCRALTGVAWLILPPTSRMLQQCRRPVGCLSCCRGARARPFHTVEYDPSIKSQRASTQLTSVPCVVQIWSRGGQVPLIIEGNETRVRHRVDRGTSLIRNSPPPPSPALGS